QDVVDGGAAPGLLDELAQLLLARVPLDLEVDADLLVPVAALVGDAQALEQAEVALDGGGDPPQVDAAGGGDVGQPGGQAGGDRVEQELHRRRSQTGADEHLRVVGVVDERDGAGGVLLAGPVEALDLAAVVGAADPGVPRPELGVGKPRVLAHGVDRGEERGDVDPVAGGTGGGGGHRYSFGGSIWCAGRYGHRLPRTFPRRAGGVPAAEGGGRRRRRGRLTGRVGAVAAAGTSVPQGGVPPRATPRSFRVVPRFRTAFPCYTDRPG